MILASFFDTSSFNTQPPEGGWAYEFRKCAIEYDVSTHSRLKAAGASAESKQQAEEVSTHSRLKAAGICT